jgi:hypothetical protein
MIITAKSSLSDNTLLAGNMRSLLRVPFFGSVWFGSSLVRNCDCEFGLVSVRKCDCRFKFEFGFEFV